jgi:hypothetical protein
VSAERQIYTEAECKDYGFGPAHPQHWNSSEIYSADGQPLDPQALMESLNSITVPRTAGAAALVEQVET